LLHFAPPPAPAHGVQRQREMAGVSWPTPRSMDRLRRLHGPAASGGRRDDVHAAAA